MPGEPLTAFAGLLLIVLPALANANRLLRRLDVAC